MRKILSISLKCILACVALVGCGRSRPVEVLVNPGRLAQLESLFTELDKAIEEHNPSLYGKLGKSAVKEDIEKLRSYLGVENKVLEMWFEWRNTSKENFAAILPLGEFISISDAIEDSEAIRSIPLVPKKRKSAFKILEDGAGDGFYIDISSDDQRVYYEILEDPSSREYYGEMEAFLEFLIEVQSASIVKVDTAGMIGYEENKYTKLEGEHLKSINK